MRIALIVLLILVQTVAARAQGMPQITMEAKEAAGPYVKRGEPFAITVTVTNQGPPIEAVARVDSPDRPIGYGTQVEVQQTVQLPSGSRKSFLLLMPAMDWLMLGGSHSQLPVVLRNPAGEELARVNVAPTMLIDADFLVLSVGPSRGGLELLQQYKRPVGNNGRPIETRLSYPDAATLPDHWAGYRSADVVILRHPGRLGLTDAQVKALLDWVAWGGTLLVVPSGDPNEIPPALRDALPARITGASTLRAQGVQNSDIGSVDLEALTLEPKPGASSILPHGYLGPGQDSLLTSDLHGRGLIVLSAADLGARDFFASDAAALRWYTAIFTASNASQEGILRPGNDTVLEHSPQMRPPSLGFLTLFMLVYVLLAGPLNYVVLKRYDRLVWMFVSVPVIALVFAGVSFGASAWSKGSATILWQVSVTQMVDGQRDACSVTWFSLFSPQRRSYDLTIPGASIVDRELGQDVSLLRSTLRDGFRLEDVSLDMWSMRRFVGSTVATLAGPVTTDLDLGGDRVNGRIRNVTGLPLEKCVIWHKGRLSELFELPPGEQSVNLALTRPRVALDTNLQRSWAAQGDAIADDNETRATLVKSVADQILRSKPPKTLLLAWSPRPIVEIGVSRSQPNRAALHLVIVRLQP